MSNYKRLTERTKHGIAILDSGERFVLSCGGYATTKALIRLAELEDKIEAGTLVTVPYAIGQEVYWMDKKGYFDVEKVKVSLITIRHDGSVDIRLNLYNADGSYCSCFKYDTKYYELFDNEEEAKQRLEDIRRKTNEP